MKLKETDIKKLLPLFMQADKEWRGLADGVNKVFRDIAEDLPKLSTWDKIDVLTDAELDDLADEIRCLWYKKDYPIEKKRSLLKTAEEVYRTLGTVYAVEEVIGKSFDGTATVQQWFEYNGNPHYFKIETTSANILNGNRLVEFLRILNIVKRKSQWLEKIIILLLAEMTDQPVSIGTAFHDATTENHYVEYKITYDGNSTATATAGVALHNVTVDNYNLM